MLDDKDEFESDWAWIEQMENPSLKEQALRWKRFGFGPSFTKKAPTFKMELEKNQNA